MVGANVSGSGIGHGLVGVVDAAAVVGTEGPVEGGVRYGLLGFLGFASWPAMVVDFALFKLALVPRESGVFFVELLDALGWGRIVPLGICGPVKFGCAEPVHISRWNVREGVWVGGSVGCQCGKCADGDPRVDIWLAFIPSSGFCLWYVWISSGACTWSAGSHVLSLLG